MSPTTSSSRAPHRLARLLTSAAVAVALLLGMTLLAAPARAAHARTDTERLFANWVLRTLNVERTVHGLAPLKADLRLRASARRHNITMSRYNTLSHQLPGEPNFARRISAAGYSWTYAGENIAYNSLMTLTGVITLEKLMYNEKAPNDGHRLNILSTHYRHVGVDVYLDSVHHRAWLTTDFGRA